MYDIRSDFTLPRGEPSKEEVESMSMWIETCCVPISYLRGVLGDVSISVYASGLEEKA